MAKEPNELKWVENLLPEGGYRRRPMFGGFGYYVEERIVMLIFESIDGSRTYKGTTYPYELWNGCMFPVEKEFQAEALKHFPMLVNHPILPKWLYLPIHSEGFDDLVESIIRTAFKPTSTWGSVPERARRKAAKEKSQELKVSVKMDTRRPRMFADEKAEDVLEKAVKISDLMNLGPVMEEAFKKAGIKTAPQFIRLGWKKALTKLAAQDPKRRHSLFAYALIGALKNQEFTRISEEDKAEARAFVKSLAPAKKNKIPKKRPPKKKPSKK